MTYHANCDSGEITDPVLAETVPFNNFVIFLVSCAQRTAYCTASMIHDCAYAAMTHQFGAVLPPRASINAPLDAARTNRYGCAMLDTKFIDDLARQISESLPAGIKGAQQDLEKNIHTLLQATFARLDLVTRQEFDTQSRVLARTREKLEQLEKTVAALEARQRQG